MKQFNNAAMVGLFMALIIVTSTRCACADTKGISRSQADAVSEIQREDNSEAAKADLEVAFKYYNGDGYEDRDDVKALGWFKKAGDLGSAKAQYYAGLMIQNGEGTSVDLKAAKQWYLQAASNGYADAQNNLGDIYAADKGGQTNLKEAANWYEKAAMQGNTKSQYSLGMLYKRGIGKTQDNDKALFWLCLASKDQTKAMIACDEMKGEMPAMKVAQIIKRAKQWKPEMSAQIQP